MTPLRTSSKVLLIMLQKALGVKIKWLGSGKRLSDSGAKLAAETGKCSASFPLGAFIAEAVVALEIVPQRFPDQVGQAFAQVVRFPSRMSPEKNVLGSLVCRASQHRPCGSSVACGMTDVARLTTRKRDIQKSQISKL